jgi:hypothetical protein
LNLERDPNLMQVFNTVQVTLEKSFPSPKENGPENLTLVGRDFGPFCLN